MSQSFFSSNAMWHHWPKVKRGSKSLELVGTQINNSSLLAVLHDSTVLETGSQKWTWEWVEAEVPVSSTVYALVEGFQADLWPYNEVIEQNGTWQDISKRNS